MARFDDVMRWSSMGLLGALLLNACGASDPPPAPSEAPSPLPIGQQDDQRTHPEPRSSADEVDEARAPTPRPPRCDLDGDGIADVPVIGDEGAFVLFGARTGAARVALAVPGPDGPSALACISDVNGDGADELAVDVSAIVYGSADRRLRVTRFRWLPVTRRCSGDEPPMTQQIAGLGDVDGDGFGDVLAANAFANDAAGGATDSGCAFLFTGSAAGLRATPVQTLQGDHSPVGFNDWRFGRSLGEAVRAAGDVDGDGHHDALVADLDGVSLLAGPRLEPRRRFADLTIAGGGLGELSTVGGVVADLDGDGHQELLLAAPAGTVVVLPGASGWDPAQGLSTQLGQEGDLELLDGGDIDGDGHADLMRDVRVAMTRHDTWVLGTDGLQVRPEPRWRIEGCAPLEAADLDHDGFSDVVCRDGRVWRGSRRGPLPPTGS